MDEAGEFANGSGVWAAFVTYSSPAYARACLEAIKNQTEPVDRVIVVDNGPPGTQIELDVDVEVVHLVMPSNVGPAGGFAAAVTRFLEGEGRYLWLMDDDVVPDPDCLKMQLADQEAHHNHAVSNPILRDYDGVIHDRYGWSGQLIPRGIVASAGPPIADYFWGSEDSEWLQFRIRDRMGVPFIRSSHGSARYDARAEMRSSPAWKYYYEARNGTHADLYRRPTVRFVHRLKRLAFRTRRLFLRASRDPGGRWARIAMIGRGIFDGVFARLGRRVAVGPPDRLSQS